MARINVTVSDEQKEWLDEQERFSPSGLLQDAIRAEMSTDTYHGIELTTSTDVEITGNQVGSDRPRPFESRAVGDRIGLVCTHCDTEAEVDGGDETQKVVSCPDCDRETTTKIKL